MYAFASLISLGIIFGMVFTVVFMVAYFGGYADIGLVIGLTILMNFIGWLISPFFMDLIYRWFYKIRRLEIQDLRARSPRLAAFIEAVCKKHNFRVPKIRLIEDDNPTAFTFGSGAYNARLVFSEGLFTYLAEDEQEAVIGHELGHIKRRDFIIMTIAATAIEILYELSQALMRRSKNSDHKKGGGALVIAGFVAYVFYIIGTYVLLFLSRTREYGADEFSAHETHNPDALSRALVKIAYGIIAKPDDSGSRRLLTSTRLLGPTDPKAAQHIGTAYQSTKDWSFVGKVLAYDFISPWAKIAELHASHPLTGKRIKRLNEISKQLNTNVSISTDLHGISVDREKLYRGFIGGVAIYFIPHIFALLVLAAAAILQDPRIAFFIPAAIGAAIIVRMLYRYPSSQPKSATTVEMLSDLYASPVRGTPYTLQGTVVGRGVAGAQFSEDLMMRDATGLIYLNYESVVGFIGNLFFALSKVRKLIGKSVQATGWFFRDIGHHFDLNTMIQGSETIRSHPKFWSMVIAIVLIGLSGWLWTTQQGILPASFT